MKLTAKQRILLALASFVVKVLWPYEADANKVWADVMVIIEKESA